MSLQLVIAFGDKKKRARFELKKNLLITVILLAANILFTDRASAALSTAGLTKLNDGFGFYISGYSSFANVSVTTSAGYVSKGQATSAGQIGIIEYGLNAGDSAIVSVNDNGTITNVSSSSISPLGRSCTVGQTTSGGFVTVAIKSDSQTADCSTNWSVPAGVTSAEVLIVGGGGGAGYYGNASNGGGGAVLRHPNYSLTPGASIPITVGAGGLGVLGGNAVLNGSIGTGGPGTNGDNSLFDGVLAIGGGGGAGGSDSSSFYMYFINGFNGGSGGAGDIEYGTGIAGTSIASSACSCTSNGWTAYGNSGAAGSSGGGGGGAGGAGSMTTAGAAVTFANFSSYSSGFAPGGSGGVNNTISPRANVGSGGGVSAGSVLGSAGASGIILIRYALVLTSSITLSATSLKTTKASGATTITATTSGTGTVSFFYNNRIINGCKNVAVNVTTATCSWRPIVHGPVSVKAIYTSGASNATSQTVNVTIGKRTSAR